MSIKARLPVDVVGDHVIEPAGHVDLHPVGEMAAVRELEPHQRVTGLKQRVIHGGVGLRSRVRLDIRVLGAEQVERARSIASCSTDVDVLTAAVVPLAGVALRVLVRQHRALAFEHGERHEVLRGDHLQRPLLAVELQRQHFGDLRVDLGQTAG